MNLSDMIRRLLFIYYDVNGRVPESFIFLRDGGSDSEWGHFVTFGTIALSVLNLITEVYLEMNAIKEGIATFVKEAAARASENVKACLSKTEMKAPKVSFELGFIINV